MPPMPKRSADAVAVPDKPGPAIIALQAIAQLIAVVRSHDRSSLKIPPRNRWHPLATLAEVPIVPQGRHEGSLLADR
jgi:hypothetical protein